MIIDRPFANRLTNVTKDDERSLDVSDYDASAAEDLAAELVDLDRKIKQLRKVRANASYDLEWFVKERDRVKRHLAQRGERSA